MKVIGIDTATAVASVALVEEGRLLLEEVHPVPGFARDASAVRERANHAEIVLPLLQRLLQRSGVSLPEVSGLAVSLGPGSFTGLRIGLSTVKGLAYGWSGSVVGVPTLLAIAMRVTSWEGLICPFLDARKKEVYAALFRAREGGLERLIEDVAFPPDRVLLEIQSLRGQEPCLFIGDGGWVYSDLIEAFLPERAFFARDEAYESTASAVARFGAKRLAKNEADPVSSLVPTYLRPSEAELKNKPFVGDNLLKRQEFYLS
ncbi:MAG: tRNA (adenosine(37)-N6)-threonylcarbamoyltransferase complex dimerization subunit type 1 TsaB [Deltaproteobacteria bacterium]|nr:tRNA (adenosine(37)-N6)-threonylcarbamoyltransferase complex dimerization subunit type 1 TsaB [Deltaproteobacteria bacterium]